MKDNAVLFEFKNGKRVDRGNIEILVSLGQWHHLRVDKEKQHVKAFINDQQVMEYEAEISLSGYLGLWTKADSVTLFKELIMKATGG